jgi:hypothetical protein
MKARGRRGSRAGLALGASILATLLAPARAAGQDPVCPLLICGEIEPRARVELQRELSYLGVNAALGALTGVVLGRGSRRSPLWRAALGASGGAVAYGGKRLSTSGAPASGLLGRQVASLGGSVVGNVAEGRGPLERLDLPAGPLRIEVETGERLAARLRVDLAGSATFLLLALDPYYELDLQRSAAAGAPVFIAGERTAWEGLHVAGNILWQEPQTEVMRQRARRTLRHEQVHVLQYDFAALAWARPLERRLLVAYDADPSLHRHFDLGLQLVPWVLLNMLLPYEARPWEREADRLAR